MSRERAIGVWCVVCGVVCVCVVCVCVCVCVCLCFCVLVIFSIECCFFVLKVK